MNNRQTEFENIIRKYGDNIYRIALVHTQNEMDAQDIVQEVFMKYAKNYKSIQSDEHLKAWLIRVTINLCTDLKRSAWSKNKAEFTEENLPAKEFETNESDVYSAVMKLPEKYKSAIHLFYYEGYSIKEIGQLTDQSESAVKTQLSRARTMLKETLEGEYEYAF